MLNVVVLPLAIHCVNGATDRRMAVVGLSVTAGTFNPTFQEIFGQAPSKMAPSKATTLTVSEPIERQLCH